MPLRIKWVAPAGASAQRLRTLLALTLQRIPGTLKALAAVLR